MKLQPDQAAPQAIQAAGPGWITIDGVEINRSILIGAKGENDSWPCQTTDEIQPAHFEQICQYQPELVLFGSGLSQRFINPRLYQCLIERGIGVETMDTLAACRTYNVLAGEGRHVMAALILGNPGEQSE
jgi:uncharacterized protein